MKNYILLFALIMGFAVNVNSQIPSPQYYIDNHPGGVGNGPIAMIIASDSSYKPSRAEQFLYPGSKFTGSPLNGPIANIYLRSGYFPSQGINLPCAIYHLKISLGISASSDFGATSSMFNNFTNIITLDSVLLDNLGVWTRIPLQSGSFNFDASKSVVMSLSLDSGFNYNQCSFLVSLSNPHDLYQGGDMTNNVISTRLTRYIDFGFDIGSTGVYNIEDHPSVLYPNPVKETLYLDKAVGKTYKIIDITGKVIDGGILTKHGIDTHMLNKGLYLLKNRDHTFKFIKE